MTARQQLTLGELTERTRPIQYGVLKPGPYVEDGIPLIRITDISSNYLDTTNVHRISKELDEEFRRSRLHGGEVLISVQGTIGKVALCPPEFAGSNISRTIAVIQPDDRVLPAYLRYSLLFKAESGGLWTVGTTRSSLNIGDLRDTSIPAPPVPEQKHIVRLLDEADDLRKLRAGADRSTAELIPALFHEMFNGLKYETNRIGELTTFVTSGSTPRGGEEVYTTEGPYFIRSQNVRMNRLDLSDAACLPLDVHNQMDRTQITPGDVLLNITGASIGRVTWIDKLDREANVSQHVCLVRPKPDLLNSVFLSVFISLPTMQRQILQVQAGASRQALNHQQVRALEIPLPPLYLQTLFANRVSVVRTLEADQAASRLRLEALFQSLLHRAFNGEL